MSAFSKLVVLFAVALSASALTAPVVARSLHDHHALAARIAAPEPVNEVHVVKPKRLRRRGDASSGRCSNIASSTSSSLTTSSTSSSTAPLATAVANVADTTSTWSTSTEVAWSSSSDAPATTSWSSSSDAPATTSWSSSSSSGWWASSTSAWAAAVTSAVGSITSGSSPFGSFFAGTNNGDGTFYSTGLGACGITNSDSDFIAAAAFGMFDSVPGYNGNPNDNPICNKPVNVHYNGKSVTVTITDRCAGCMSSGNLDLSPAAFQAIADESLGRIQITWEWA